MISLVSWQAIYEIWTSGDSLDKIGPHEGPKFGEHGE